MSLYIRIVVIHICNICTYPNKDYVKTSLCFRLTEYMVGKHIRCLSGSIRLYIDYILLLGIKPIYKKTHKALGACLGNIRCLPGSIRLYIDYILFLGIKLVYKKTHKAHGAWLRNIRCLPGSIRLYIDYILLFGIKHIYERIHKVKIIYLCDDLGLNPQSSGFTHKSTTLPSLK